MEKIRRVTKRDDKTEEDEIKFKKPETRPSFSVQSTDMQARKRSLETRPRNTSIHYKYNEGLTNAISRPARLVEFL